MLSVFKLVSCTPGASRELALRPPGPEKLEMFSSSLWLCNCIYRDTFYFFWFYNYSKAVIPKL